MAHEIRVRADFVTGTVLDDPLAFDGTSFNSDELAALPAIGSTQHAAIVLDPFGEANGPEIAWVMTHADSATVASIQRGLEGTDPVEHPAGTRWAHSPTTWDYGLVVADDSDLPLGAWEGMRGYERPSQTGLVWNGVRWDREWRLPWGVLDANVDNGSGLLGGFITTEQVVLTTNQVTHRSGRRLRVEMSCAISTPSSDAIPILRVRRGNTTGGALVRKATNYLGRHDVADDMGILCIDNPSGSTTTRYCLTVESFTAVAATGPWSWSIEDVGAYTTPS